MLNPLPQSSAPFTRESASKSQWQSSTKNIESLPLKVNHSPCVALTAERC